jgi:hypothetical protein
VRGFGGGVVCNVLRLRVVICSVVCGVVACLLAVSLSAGGMYILGGHHGQAPDLADLHERLLARPLQVHLH